MNGTKRVKVKGKGVRSVRSMDTEAGVKVIIEHEPGEFELEVLKTEEE